MFDIAVLDEPTELLLQPTEKKSHYASREQSRSNEVCEPEECLWKAQAVSPRFARIELFALILFLTIAVGGVVSGIAELSQLITGGLF